MDQKKALPCTRWHANSYKKNLVSNAKAAASRQARIASSWIPQAVMPFETWELRILGSRLLLGAQFEFLFLLPCLMIHKILLSSRSLCLSQLIRSSLMPWHDGHQQQVALACSVTFWSLNNTPRAMMSWWKLSRTTEQSIWYSRIRLLSLCMFAFSFFIFLHPSP